MPRIYQQAKTFFAPLRYIAAAGLSVAFATSAFAQVTQPRQAEPTRSEVTTRARANEKIDIKACVDADIERYVLDLGTPKLTNDEFEALVKCGSQAVPSLSHALKSESSDLRVSAIYALGQIGSEAETAVPLLIEVLQDKDSIIRATAAYTLGRIGPKAEEAVPYLTKIFKDLDEGETVHARVAQALREIGTKRAIAVLTLSNGRSNNSARCGFLDIHRVRRCMTSVKLSASVKGSSPSPLVCQLPGIKVILPRCR